MRVIRIALLLCVVLTTVPFLEKEAEASHGFYLGFAYSHPAYWYYYRPYFFYHPYYYGPYYYRPYRYYAGYYGEVRTEVKPNDAKVYVDGDYVGRADDFDGWWQRLELEPGRHRITFRLEGYRPYSVTIRVLPGRDYHIKHQMEPGEDVITEEEMRPEREDRDDYGRERYRDRDFDRNRDSDRDRRMDRQQERRRDSWEEPSNSARKYTITLGIEPPDAAVYVDGEYYGTADVNHTGEITILLSEGIHQIEVVRPGYESHSEEIMVDDKTDRLVIQLKKK